MYVGDIQVAKGTGYGYIVTTSECNGKIKSIDTSEALKMPGVIGFVDATDIVGKNSSSPLGEPYPFPEQAFPQYTPTYVFVPAGGKIGHYGQFVGCMIARTRREAKAAASRVKIEYESVGAPVRGVRARSARISINSVFHVSITGLKLEEHHSHRSLIPQKKTLEKVNARIQTRL